MAPVATIVPEALPAAPKLCNPCKLCICRGGGGQEGATKACPHIALASPTLVPEACVGVTPSGDRLMSHPPRECGLGSHQCSPRRREEAAAISSLRHLCAYRGGAEHPTAHDRCLGTVPTAAASPSPLVTPRWSPGTGSLRVPPRLYHSWGPRTPRSLPLPLPPSSPRERAQQIPPRPRHRAGRVLRSRAQQQVTA